MPRPNPFLPIFWLLSLLILLAGCSNNAPLEQPRSTTHQQTEIFEPQTHPDDEDLNRPETDLNNTLFNRSQPNKPLGTPALNPAVQSLVTQAKQQMGAGQLDAAEATLERGLRISPQNALIWFELAKLAQQQGEHQKSHNLASRAYSLAGQQSQLRDAIQQFMRQ